MSVHDAGCSKAGQPHTGFESCCPGTTPTTDARERAEYEARDRVLRAIRSDWWIEKPRALDAYRTAVLATERARVRAVVLSQPEVFVPMSMRVGRNDERYIDGANLLDRLDAEPTP